MKNFPLIATVATILIIIGGVFLLSKGEKPIPIPPANSVEYFWRVGCPHCENVDKFLSTWPNENKITINKFEVGSDGSNAKRLQQRAISCNIPAAEIGVPLLFTPEGKCFTGDTPIIDFFTSLSSPSASPKPKQ